MFDPRGVHRLYKNCRRSSCSTTSAAAACSQDGRGRHRPALCGIGSSTEDEMDLIGLSDLPNILDESMNTYNPSLKIHGGAEPAKAYESDSPRTTRSSRQTPRLTKDNLQLVLTEAILEPEVRHAPVGHPPARACDRSLGQRTTCWFRNRIESVGLRPRIANSTVCSPCDGVELNESASLHTGRHKWPQRAHPHARPRSPSAFYQTCARNRP